MKKGPKEILVIGDRVLIIPDMGDDRSNSGLYLPKWAVEKESVQGGRIVETGPGIPLPSPNDVEQEPWKKPELNQKHIPLQARVGDYAIFLRKSAVEVKMDKETYLIVPQAALLLLIREKKQHE
ncbi:co-chaperone GroES [candidate division KSB1 bacterium]|nr:co-chaperone GroES [candidate division KSB1 bacterium]